MVHGKTIDGSELAARIPAPWRTPTLAIARTLGGAGHRAWVVGGTVRDLILERPVKDVDIVSSALPEDVERLFDKTIPVGKAFGIVVVVMDGLEVEVATFREETGYSDQRHPDSIIYATDPRVDARRRDFTCNALFLDPLDGTIEDPTGGLADLGRRELRAVGDAVDRFREDGLRLIRMARFAASLGLEPAPGLLEAAKAERGSLAGVSPERVLGELEKTFAGGRTDVALRIMEDAGLSELCLPHWDLEGFDPAQRSRRIRMFGAMQGPIPVSSGLAVLFGDTDTKATMDRVAALRASRSLREAASSLWEHSVLLENWAAKLAGAAAEWGSGALEDPEERGRRAMVARMAATAPAMAIASARAEADGGSTEPFTKLEKELQRRAEAAPTEPFELSGGQLMALGVDKGPAVGLAMARMRMASLGGAFCDASGAEDWLRRAGLIK